MCLPNIFYCLLFFHFLSLSLRAPNYNQKKISFAHKGLKENSILSLKINSEMKTKKLSEKFSERKRFSHRTVLLEFPTKTKATLTFLPTKAWHDERYSRKMSFSGRKSTRVRERKAFSFICFSLDSSSFASWEGTKLNINNFATLKLTYRWTKNTFFHLFNNVEEEMYVRSFVECSFKCLMSESPWLKKWRRG